PGVNLGRLGKGVVNAMAVGSGSGGSGVQGTGGSDAMVGVVGGSDADGDGDGDENEEEEEDALMTPPVTPIGGHEGEGENDFSTTGVISTSNIGDDDNLTASTSTTPAPTRPSQHIKCPARFRRRQELLRHIRSVHGAGDADRPWICPGDPTKCGRRFARGDALRRHLESFRARGREGGCSVGMSDEDISNAVRNGRVGGGFGGFGGGGEEGEEVIWYLTPIISTMS
ncbi:hypothetical protein HDU76_009936, partial [Blyttiomyces sp. JEL0837]